MDMTPQKLRDLQLEEARKRVASALGLLKSDAVVSLLSELGNPLHADFSGMDDNNYSEFSRVFTQYFAALSQVTEQFSQQINPPAVPSIGIPDGSVLITKERLAELEAAARASEAAADH